MPKSFSIGHRSLSLNSLFAGMACAITLTLTVGPALAQPTDMERVEVKGRIVEAPARYDVHTACNDLEGQLQSALERTWAVEARYGEVKVQFVMDNGEVSAVQAKGISNIVARDVRHAVNRLHCGKQTTAGVQVYRFSVDFIDPRAPASDTRTARKPGSVRVAVLSR